MATQMLLRVLSKLRRLFVEDVVDLIYVYDLATSIPPFELAKGVEITPLTSDLLSKLALAPAKVADFRERMKASRGFVATRDGQLAGWAWFTTNPRPREGEPPFFYEVKPPPGWGYIYDTFVMPEHRGLGLAVHLKIACLEHAKKTGVAKVFQTHDEKNAAILRVSDKLGFKRAGALRYKRRLWYVVRDLSAMLTEPTT